MTGQHDRQDEKLTGQLPNQSGHCPLTGRYFEPCYSVQLEYDTSGYLKGFDNSELALHQNPNVLIKNFLTVV